MSTRPPLQLSAPGARLTVAPDGRVAVDEDTPGALALALATAVAGPDPVLTTDHGTVHVVRDAPVGPVAGRVRTVDVDQTHRSWVVDGTLQVKVGGTLGALDHGADQARRAAATGAVPTLRGTVGWSGPGGHRVLATVTDHVAGAQDGWTWAVDDVLAALGAPSPLAVPAAPTAPAMHADPGAPTDPAAPTDPGHPALLAWPAELGALAARLHVALAAAAPPAGVPGPDPDPTARARTALDEAVAATTGATHRRLVARAAALRRAIDGAPADPTSPPFAVHGDLHVGQVLRAQGRYWVVDLDGDPQIGPWLDHAARDLAHLLVSVDTVARVVQRRLGAPDPRALAWADQARDQLLDAYCTELAQAGRTDLLDERLLPTFEAEQVLRELLYAARYLPRWTYAGEGALLARYPAARTHPCGACTDPACGTDEEEPWTPPPFAPTSS